MSIALRVAGKMPSQILKEVQDIDRNILINAVNTDPKHLSDLVDFYEKQALHTDKKIVENAKIQLGYLQELSDFKVALMRMSFGLYTPSADALQAEIDFEANKNVKMADYTKDGKLKIPARKDSAEKKEKNKYFQGYERKVIFGTPAEFSIELQKLIPLADSMEKINEVATILIKEGKEEDALNLSIDLAEKFGLSKIGFPREVIEEKFMFELLPICKGVKLNLERRELKDLVLVNWVNFLNNSREIIKTKVDVIKQAVKDIKSTIKKGKPGYISIGTRNKIIEFQKINVELEDEILSEVAKELKIKSSEIQWEAISETEAKFLTTDSKKFIFTGESLTPIKVDPFKGGNLADLKTKCLAMLKDQNLGEKKIIITRKYFIEGIQLVTDYEHKKDEAKINGVWAAIASEFLGKDKIIPEPTVATTPIVTPPPAAATDPTKKEEIVAKAEEEAIKLAEKEKEMSETEKKIREEVKQAVDAHDKYGYDTTNKILKKYKHQLKKENKKFDAIELWNEISGDSIISDAVIVDEVKKEDDKPAETSKHVPLPKPVDIKTEFPVIWKEATECESLGDFIAYLKLMMSDTEEVDLKSAVDGKSHTKTMIACGLSQQHLRNFKECKDWDNKKVFDWWLTFRDKYIKDKEQELGIGTSPLKGKESSGTQKADDSSEKKGGEPKNANNPGKKTSEQQKKKDGKQPVDGVKDTNMIDKPASNSVIPLPAGDVSNKTIQSAGVVQKKDGNSVNSTSKLGEVKGSQSAEQSAKESGLKEKPTTSTPEKNVPEKPAGTLKEVIVNASDAAGMKKDVELGEALSGKQSQTNLGNSEKVEDSANSNQQETVQDQSKVDLAAEQAKLKKKEAFATVNTSNQNSDSIIAKCLLIEKEKDKKVVNKLISEIILDTESKLTFIERMDILIDNYLSKNRKWDNTPRSEIMNHIVSVIRKMKTFNETEEAKAFEADMLKRKADEKEAKQRKALELLENKNK